MNDIFIIDFDRTFIKSDSTQDLIKIMLKNNPDKKKIENEIILIDTLTKEEKLNYGESITRKLKLFDINKTYLDKLKKELNAQLTTSIKKNKEFFRLNNENIYIISGGFKEIISPIVRQFGILDKNIIANEFVTKKNETYSFEDKNILSAKTQTQNLIKKLPLKRNIFLIGNSFSDAEADKLNYKIKNIAFYENLHIGDIKHSPSKKVESFDEFLYSINVKASVSYPKSKMKALFLENIHPKSNEFFVNQGYKVETINGSINESELCKKIKDISILGIRSKSIITKKVIDNANKLIAIGAYCIGTNQIDLEYCTKNGIAVFNAPYSNTRSVVELTLAEIIFLLRHIADKSRKMHEGIWDKSANKSYEIRGKKLGIIGYGNIGTQLGVLAENLGMEVYFYDIIDKLALGNAKKCEKMSEILKTCDIISVHVDGRKENINLIAEKEFNLMKTGVIFLNLSRGFVVDINFLYKFIKLGKIGGVGIDVFPDEPDNNEGFVSILRNLPNVILTPHIGGSTEEAQKNIGKFVSGKITNYMDLGDTSLSVNFPNLNLVEMKSVHRLIHVHKNVPGVLAKINTLLAENKINIRGQYLGTNDQIGYVITDINKSYSDRIINNLKDMPETIKFRILY